MEEETRDNSYISRSVVCNGNGVFGISLKKQYAVTTDKDKVTCKKCLKIMKLYNIGESS